MSIRKSNSKSKFKSGKTISTKRLIRRNSKAVKEESDEIKKSIDIFSIKHSELMREYEERKQYKRTHYKYWTKADLKQRVDSLHRTTMGLKSLTNKDLRTKIKNIEFQLDYSVSVNKNETLRTRYIDEISRYNIELDERRFKRSRYVSLKELTK